MPPNRLPRSSVLSETLASRLQGWIVEAALAPGAALPSEKALGERFGVSRAVVREAISRLKAEGCVETRQGAGAFVVAQPGAAVFRVQRAQPMARVLADVFELRYLVECGAAELAARRRNQDDLTRLHGALLQMDVAVQAGSNAAVEDDAFHVAIAAATHNPQIEAFVSFMGRQFSDTRAPAWDAVGQRRGLAASAQAEHRALYVAIASGDGEMARQAAREHLDRVAARLGLDMDRWPDGTAVPQGGMDGVDA